MMRSPYPTQNAQAPARRNLPPIQRPRPAQPSQPAVIQANPLDKVIFYGVVFVTVYSLSSMAFYLAGYFWLPALIPQAIPLGLAVTLMLELAFLAIELKGQTR